MNTIETSDIYFSTEETAVTGKTNISTVSGLPVSAAVAGISTLFSEAADAAVAITSSSKPTHQDAWRFLTQATFGPTEADLRATATLRYKGYVAWLNEQFLKQPKDTTYNLSIKNRYCVKPWDPIRFEVGHETTVSAIWEQFLTGPDQLRQRVAFALSEIMVVSLRDGFNLTGRSLAVASYHDMLAKNAFGSFKTLVRDMCRHPAMGDFLSHLGNGRPIFSVNQPRDDKGRLPTQRIPDQNFARELMQLFTIGLVKLNMDGTPILENGQPVETYTQHDIEVLSYVFTGWFWDLRSLSPELQISVGLDSGIIADSLEPLGNMSRDERFADKKTNYWPPMAKLMIVSNDARDHAQPTDYVNGFGTAPLTFLGSSFVPTGTGLGDLDAALNILLNHPNVAPFIARQMIQRLVTSNPTPAYVRRVATQFKASNLSMKTLVQAILLDTEARDTVRISGNTPFALSFGKLREPVLRITAALRALGFDAHKHISASESKKCYFIPQTYRSVSGAYYDSTQTLGQGPYQAPSVFNFYRPGYIEPGTALNAPEFQASSGVELTAYIDFVESMLDLGGCGYYYWGGDFMPDTLPSSVNRLIPDDFFEEGMGGISRKQNLRLGVYYSLDKLLAAIDLDAASGSVGWDFSNVLFALNDAFFGGVMSLNLQSKLQEVLRSKFSNAAGNLQGSTPYFRSVALKQCVFLVLVSPEFVVQR